MIASHFVRREILDRRDELNARIVDHDIQPVEFSFRALDHRLDLIGFGHVGGIIKRVIGQGGTDRLDLVRISKAVDHDAATFIGQLLGNAKANARCGSGDDG